MRPSAMEAWDQSFEDGERSTCSLVLLASDEAKAHALLTRHSTTPTSVSKLHFDPLTSDSDSSAAFATRADTRNYNKC